MNFQVYLDRDGVINEDNKDYVRTKEDFLWIEGSLEALVLLNQAGVRVGVFTNQGGINKGLFKTEALLSLHLKLLRDLEREAPTFDFSRFTLAFCPHTDQDNCLCRKPKPGMIDLIASTWNLPPQGFCIGDQPRDLEAGRNRNLTPLLVKTGQGATFLKEGAIEKDVLCFQNLYEAATHLLTSPTTLVK